MSTDLIPYVPGDNLGRADVWAQLDEDARKRQAAAAAATHDDNALWSLTESWLILYGRKGAHISPRTIDRYQRGVRMVLESWRGENILHPSRMAGTRWLRGLEASGYKPSTVQVMLAAARSLYAALRSSGATDADPFKDLYVMPDPVPAWEKRRPYSDAEVDTLLAHAQGEMRLVVLLGAHAGLRVSEMVALRWDDVDLSRKRLVVMKGKGGKKRTVPLSKALRDEPAVHQCPSGVVLHLESETTKFRSTAIWWRMKTLCQSAGVTPLGVHSLRHTAATRMVRQDGGNLDLAAQLLGHADIQVTRRYAKVDDAQVAAAVEEW